jgi:hypothetical protein
MFGLNVRLVTLFAWLTFWPAMRCLPQTKHFAMGISSDDWKAARRVHLMGERIGDEGEGLYVARRPL